MIAFLDCQLTDALENELCALSLMFTKSGFFRLVSFDTHLTALACHAVRDYHLETVARTIA